MCLVAWKPSLYICEMQTIHHCSLINAFVVQGVTSLRPIQEDLLICSQFVGWEKLDWLREAIYGNAIVRTGYYINIMLFGVVIYILNTKNLAPPIFTIFFFIKIDDFKIQCYLVSCPCKRLLLQGKRECRASYIHFWMKKCKKKNTHKKPHTKTVPMNTQAFPWIRILDQKKNNLLTQAHHTNNAKIWCY